MTLILLFILGICLGSFLNVVIDRWPNDQSIIKGRSHCDYCKHTLSPLDLIPVLSYFLIGAKCRHCHKKLSVQYPVIELATAILMVTTYIFSINTVPKYLFDQISYNNLFVVLNIAVNEILALYFLVIFMIDLKYEVILDNIINSALLLTLVVQVLYLAGLFFLTPRVVFIDNAKSLLIAYLCGIILAVFFRFLIFVSRGRGLGEGDIKLGLWLGIILGFPNILPGMLISFVSGGIIGLLLIIFRRKKFGQTVPLAPFLVTGAYISLFFGNQIMNWYINFFLK